MNTATLIPPPALENRTGSGVVAVHVGKPEMALFPDLFPPDNLVGAQLVTSLLNAALRREGHLIAPAHLSVVGQLFDCAGLVEVADPIGAADVIVRELCGTLLAGVFQVAIHTEGHWQAVWPNDAGNLDAVFDWDRISQASARMFDLLRIRCGQVENLLALFRQQLQVATAEAERQPLQRAIASLETTAEGFRSVLARADESDHTS